jgi:hypothetical protein
MSPNRDDNRFDILRLLAAWLVLLSHCFPLGARPQSEPMLSTLGFDTLAIQPASPGLRAEETCVIVDVPLGSTPHMTGKPLVPLWPVR